MSVKIMSRVWEHSTQKAGARLLLLAIADNARDDDGHAWPGIAYLSKKCRMNERTIRRLLVTLEQADELYVHRKRGYSNHYIVLVGMAEAEASQAIGALVEKRGQNTTPDKMPRVPRTKYPGGKDTHTLRSVINHQKNRQAQPPQPPDLPEEYRIAEEAYENSRLDDIAVTDLHYSVKRAGLPVVLEAIRKTDLKPKAKRTPDYFLGTVSGLMAEGWRPPEQGQDAPVSIAYGQEVV